MASTVEATVVAVFEDASDAQSAVNDLKAAGFGSDRVFVSSEGVKPSAGYAGETTGAVAHEGGITGWFRSLFGTEEHAHRQGYEGAVAGGHTIVSVDTPESNVDKISDILEKYSPVDIHTDDTGAARGISTSNVYNAGSPGSSSDVLNARDEIGRDARTPGTNPVTSTAGATARTVAGTAAGAVAGLTDKAMNTAGQTIPILNEELQVGKRTVQRGGVRVYSRVTDKPVEESVNLREEHVRVDRQPVNRPATDADFQAGRDQVIEVAEYAEEPVVAKQARVVEEVRVNKQATERTETIRENVRQTEVGVESLGTGVATGLDESTSSDADYRRHFAAAYPAGTANYDDYAPAYRYGSEIANDPKYQGRDYSSIESDLREDYARRYPNSTWDRMKDSIRYGWDKVTGKARTTTATR